MSHARQQIRDAIVSALTGAGMTAYSSRAYSVPSTPSVNVATGSEDAEIDTIGTGDQLRTLTIMVDLMVAAAENVDDAADAQAVTIEKTILGDSATLALVKWIEYRGIESELSGDGDKAILVLSHAFEMQYRVNELDPEVIIP